MNSRQVALLNQDNQILSSVAKDLRGIGYHPNLLRFNYRFNDVLGPVDTLRQIHLAAFGQEPPSYRSACMGITLKPQDGAAAIMEYRALGAPQILSIDPAKSQVQRWKVRAHGEPDLLEVIPLTGLTRLLQDHSNEWNPESVIRAKSIAYKATSPQMDFFDTGLIPVLEKEVHLRLDRLLHNVLTSAREAYVKTQRVKPDDQIYKKLFTLVFKLLAAKMLGDREHPGAWLDEDVEYVISEINKFYFRSVQPEPVVRNKEIRRIVWDQIRTSIHLQNISVEALAYIYEDTFVDEKTRNELDTHATPPEIAEYVVSQLPFERLEENERRVFELFSGHAPFLIAALGRLRSLLPSSVDLRKRHEYFQMMLLGIEKDLFAREVARYSLILADYPNSDGWQIDNGDVFASRKLDGLLSRSRIVLCNPPFGDFSREERRRYNAATANKAVEALRRVLSFPPPLLGFVLPLSFINGQSYRELRRQIATSYSSVQIVALPDVAFRHSEHETILLIASALDEAATSISMHVAPSDYGTFVRSGAPTSSIVLRGESAFKNAEETLWISPLIHQLQEATAHLQRFSEIAEVHRGIEYVDSVSKFVLDTAPKGHDGQYRPGLQQIRDQIEAYFIRRHSYLRIDPKSMRGNSYLLPWEQPKIIANAHRSSRGPWTLIAAIDTSGLYCYQNYHGIWPKPGNDLRLIAALLNGPLANTFITLRRGTPRDNQVRLINQIPIPSLSKEQANNVRSLVKTYERLRKLLERSTWRRDELQSQCKQALLSIDAEILAAYKLPPRLEKELLDSFAGFQRPVTFQFERYYPSKFEAAIPLQLYLSRKFHDATAQKTVERLPIIADPSIDSLLVTLQE